MTVSLSQITAKMNKRTKGTASLEILSYINEEIKNDIGDSAYKAWPEYFGRTVTISVLPGVTEYDLPDDFGSMIAMSRTSNTNVRRGRNAPDGFSGEKNYISIVGGKLKISSESSLSDIVIDYNIPFPDFPTVGNIDDDLIGVVGEQTIGLPTDIAEALILTWAAGVDYYVFSDSRKFDRAQTSFNKYTGARSGWAVFSVGSLS